MTGKLAQAWALCPLGWESGGLAPTLELLSLGLGSWSPNPQALPEVCVHHG